MYLLRKALFHSFLKWIIIGYCSWAVEFKFKFCVSISYTLNPDPIPHWKKLVPDAHECGSISPVVSLYQACRRKNIPKKVTKFIRKTKLNLFHPLFYCTYLLYVPCSSSPTATARNSQKKYFAFSLICKKDHTRWNSPWEKYVGPNQCRILDIYSISPALYSRNLLRIGGHSAANLIWSSPHPPVCSGLECGKLDLLSDTGDLDAGVDSSAILIEGAQVRYRRFERLVESSAILTEEGSGEIQETWTLQWTAAQFLLINWSKL